MRWDPTEDRRYALLDRDPTAGDNKSRTGYRRFRHASTMFAQTERDDLLI
jgi:hypothetical protein